MTAQFDSLQLQDIDSLAYNLEGIHRTESASTYQQYLQDQIDMGYGVCVVKATDAVIQERARQKKNREQERKNIFKWICDGDETLAEQLEERYREHIGNLVP